MPDETRELIFDTIKFVENFQKYRRDRSFYFCTLSWNTTENFIYWKRIFKRWKYDSVKYKWKYVKNATISKEEISALAKVFSFYIKFPESRWSDIKIAEKNDEEGNKMFQKLGKEFDEKYRDYKASSMDLHD